MNLNGSTINFPFRPDVRGSLVTTATRSEIIAQAIADVVETRQGERVMLPDYGLPDFVFAAQDIGFAARISYHIEQQIIKYVPLVASISVTAETEESGRAIVSLKYTEVGEINAPKNLVFPVWQYTGEIIGSQNTNNFRNSTGSVIPKPPNSTEIDGGTAEDDFTGEIDGGNADDIFTGEIDGGTSGASVVEPPLPITELDGGAASSSFTEEFDGGTSTSSFTGEIDGGSN